MPSKIQPAPHREVADGETPHGGTYMVTYYFDSKYKPVEKKIATRAIVHEYDDKNRSLFRDYLAIEKIKDVKNPEKPKLEAEIVPNASNEVATSDPKESIVDETST